MTHQNCIFEPVFCMVITSKIRTRNEMVVIKHLYFTFLLLSLVSPRIAAQDSVSSCYSDMRLLDQLVGKGSNTEADFLLRELQANGCHDIHSDSLNYYQGFIHYQHKRFDSAAHYLLQVKQPEQLREKSLVLAAINFVYLDMADSALTILEGVTSGNATVQELVSLEKAGCNLLMGKDEAFLEATSRFSMSLFVLKKEQKNLMDIYANRSKNKVKKPGKAALYSALVPGWGKWYSKQRGGAAAAFLTVLVMGGVTAEQAWKGGWQSLGAIAASSVTAVFYIGNIYGGYYSAKHFNKRVSNGENDNIKYNLHVAFRNVYF